MIAIGYASTAHATPMAPVAQRLAAVAVPRTISPVLRIAPPPIKAHTCNHSFDDPGESFRMPLKNCLLARTNPQLATATSGNVTNSGASVRALSFPADRKGNDLRDAEVKKWLSTGIIPVHYTFTGTAPFDAVSAIDSSDVSCQNRARC